MYHKAVLFDFDGTLTLPGLINFKTIRSVLQCPDNIGILEFINSISDITKKQEALRKLNEFEFTAANKSFPNDNAEKILRHFLEKCVPLGIISRNSLQSIKKSLKNFKTIKLSDFNVVISRDNPVKPKPSSEGIILAAEKINVPLNCVFYVGDYLFDIEAAITAGVTAVYLSNGKRLPEFTYKPDFIIDNLSELISIVKVKRVPLNEYHFLRRI